MARKRTRKPKLPRLLENSTSVIAVIDDEFEVLFANTSCLNWLDISLETLVGAQLKFGPQNQSSLAAATGICPDPACFDPAKPAQQSGFVFAVRDGTQVWKTASFNRIEDADKQTYVVVIAEGPELQQPDENQTASAHIRLHNLFAKIRKQNRNEPTIEQFVGNSPAATRLRRQIEAAADNQADCLIVGPTGSGREHIARTIFNQRNLPNTNLIPIHCTIADSQFLQNSIKEWAFKQRESKTKDWLLLLDVDKMNAQPQVELFGYTQIPDFPLRIIATSEANLIQSAIEEEFHAALASHLSVQTIESPALKNRKSDIPLLCQFFIESHNQQTENQISGVSEPVVELFYEYHWPGNIDELKRVVLEACSTCKHSTILPEHLSDKFNHSISAHRIGYYQTDQIQLDEYLSEIEKELIGRALSQAQNNKTKAAELLGISRAKLLRRATAFALVESDKNTARETDQVDPSAFKEAD